MKKVLLGTLKWLTYGYALYIVVFLVGAFLARLIVGLFQW